MKNKYLDKQIAEVARKNPSWGRDRIAKALNAPYSTVRNALRRLQATAEAKPDKPSESLAVQVAKKAPIEFGRLGLEHVDAGDWFRVGLVADTHLCCQEERLEALHCQYDLFKSEGISSVLHAGNLVDGCVPKINGASVIVSTPDDQAQYVIDNYPTRAGITTYYITGDDHEGWWIKQGLNWGIMLQYMAKAQAREDLHYIGHVEADVEIMVPDTVKKPVIKIQHPGGGSCYARSYAPQRTIECVPLNAEILTRSGWKKWNEIQVGEQVLGHNVETRLNEWTVLRAVHRGRAPVTRYYNDQFDVVCTTNHRWVLEQECRAGANSNSRVPVLYSRRYRTLEPIIDTWRRTRLVQAAPSPSGPGLGAFPYEAWLQRNALASLRVMEMTSGERRAFIEGLLLGEGTGANTKNPDGSVKWRSISFSQNAGPVMNAFRLACFLEGINTTERDCKGGSFKPAVTHHRSATLCCKALRITANPKLKREEFPETDVWCPTTDLGTWVMRQGRTITITGNSLEGGEKPDVLVQGHYHVNGFWNERNVHVVTLPGFQDQTIFGRKKRLRFEVGGAILEFKVNSAGAITRCRCEFNMFFNRGYYKAFLRSDRKLLKGHLRLTV